MFSLPEISHKKIFDLLSETAKHIYIYRPCFSKESLFYQYITDYFEEFAQVYDDRSAHTIHIKRMILSWIFLLISIRSDKCKNSKFCLNKNSLHN